MNLNLKEAVYKHVQDIQDIGFFSKTYELIFILEK